MNNDSNSNSNLHNYGFSPYDLCRNSGTLNFWNDPEEDIYTDEDGKSIDE